MHPVGVIHGRFQVLHNDHLEYLLAGKRLCEHLVVGITNPDPALTAGEEADPERDDPANNPLTYWERQVMVREVLTGAGVSLSDFSVVPLPINKPERFHYYVPMDALFFLTIYDDWGRAKLRRFRELELETHVLWERSPEEKGISAGTVREALARGEDVSDVVPPETLRLVKRWGLAQRLREMCE